MALIATILLFLSFFSIRLSVLFKLSQNIKLCLSSAFISLLGFHIVTLFTIDLARSDIQIWRFAGEIIVETNHSTFLNKSIHCRFHFLYIKGSITSITSLYPNRNYIDFVVMLSEVGRKKHKI